MADTVVIDVDELSPEPSSAKKSMKRKRTPSIVESLSTDEREARINALTQELDGLFKYYKEVLEVKKVYLHINECRSSNSVIACLLEESNLPLSKLVDQIYEKLNDVDGSFSFSLASIKSSVLLIGQRLFYGVPNSDADLLEDDDNSCLWCWETRDLKLLPKSVRGALKIRRTCRKKIHERISAVSAMITALQKLTNKQNCKQELNKALERLGRVLCEADIRLLVESMLQKNGTVVAEKEMKRESKLLVKELDKNQREVEKEKRRMELELQKEKSQSEKEVKRLQEDAEKKERQREKEESEMRKQLKRQQEEAEREQLRREKEEATLKKQAALQKQASLMERFLKRSKNNSPASQSPVKLASHDSSPEPNRKENMQDSVTLLMDSALSHKDEIKLEDIWKLHLSSWHNLGCSNRKQHWGIRQKPKMELVKELKLTMSKEIPCEDDSNFERTDDGWDETKYDGRPNNAKPEGSLPIDKKFKHKQLLQFDKTNRPAFYGIWPKKSIVVGPRHPLVKDPDLDYEIDSDEEWEEEEPGESLSDCEKDEEESLEEGHLKADDEDEIEDGFFVPDGYLSENEGVQVDGMECDEKTVLEACSRKQDVECEEELLTFFRQQKCLHNLTEHALRKNRPLIISNFSKDNNTSCLSDKGLTESCLEALSMRAFPGVGPSVIDIPVLTDDLQADTQEASPSQIKGGSTTPVPKPTTILDSDLPQIVSIIQSCSQGINKVVESLHHQFPTVPKTHLRNKMREMSDFVDNRWQVKKDILTKLGLPTTPDKGSRMKEKTITTFFSKRCLPPSTGKDGNDSNKMSPQKPSSTTSAAAGTTADH